VLIFALILTFMIGEGLPPFGTTVSEILQRLGFFAAWLGMLVLWRREGIGGGMVLCGLGTFYAVEWIGSGRFPGGWVFPLMYLPGVLALICRWQARRIAATADGS